MFRHTHHWPRPPCSEGWHTHHWPRPPCSEGWHTHWPRPPLAHSPLAPPPCSEGWHTHHWPRPHVQKAGTLTIGPAPHVQKAGTHQRKPLPRREGMLPSHKVPRHLGHCPLRNYQRATAKPLSVLKVQHPWLCQHQKIVSLPIVCAVLQTLLCGRLRVERNGGKETVHFVHGTGVSSQG